MGALRARARISLRAVEGAGLEMPLPTGTKSLLLCFDSGMEDPPTVTVGAVIEPVAASSLDPGARDLDVWLTFWADEAEIFATPGAPFELRYGRPVGDGTIYEVIKDRS